MRISIFNGSPRGKNSNTHWMVSAFMEGARDAGANVSNVFLVKKKIRHCRGCFACWTKTPGECIQKDDMPALLEDFIQADVVVFATPVYVDNVTGLMKTFMDRLIPFVDPHFEKDPNGEYRHVRRYPAVPKVAVIANCGLPEQSHFQVLRLLFRRIARNMQSEVVAEIYRGAGELLGRPNAVLKPFLARYNRLLHTAGMELVRGGAFSPKTMGALEKPLVPKRLYIAGGNRWWDQQRKEAEAQKTGGSF